MHRLASALWMSNLHWWDACFIENFLIQKRKVDLSVSGDKRPRSLPSRFYLFAYTYLPQRSQLFTRTDLTKAPLDEALLDHYEKTMVYFSNPSFFLMTTEVPRYATIICRVCVIVTRSSKEKESINWKPVVWYSFLSFWCGNKLECIYSRWAEDLDWLKSQNICLGDRVYLSSTRFWITTGFSEVKVYWQFRTLKHGM